MANNKKTFTGKLLRYERRNNSYYGNPKYFGVFEDAEGNILYATTATNASCAYGFFELSRTGKNTHILHNKNRQQHY